MWQTVLQHELGPPRLCGFLWMGYAHASEGWGKEALPLPVSDYEIFLQQHIIAALGLHLTQTHCFSHRKPTFVLFSWVPGDQGDITWCQRACKFKGEGRNPTAVSGYMVVIQTIYITHLDYFCLDYHQN